MIFKVMLVLSVATVVLSCLLAWLASVKRKGGKGLFSPLNILIVGVFLAGFMLYYPIYRSNSSITVVEVFMNTVHDVLQLFTVDSSFATVYDGMKGLTPNVARLYTVWFSLLYGLSPLLTFGFILSLFKNAAAYRRYCSRFFSDVYVFSELNERSLAFAQNILQSLKEQEPNGFVRWAKHVKSIFQSESFDNKDKTAARTVERDGVATVVFLDVEEDEDDMLSLADRAAKLGAILFPKDILSVRLKFHSKRKNLFFFLISENESENVDRAIGALSIYGKRPNTHVYVFSDSTESELLLNHADIELPKNEKELAKEEKRRVKTEKKVKKLTQEASQKTSGRKKLEKWEKAQEKKQEKEENNRAFIKRVNVIRSLINHTLYETGKTVFDKALPAADGEKDISAVIIGMGLHGTEMVKSLSWYGQMIGYRMHINAYDQDPAARAHFAAKCPELMCEKYNGPAAEGKEDCYRISIHEMDVTSDAFEEHLKTLPPVTYVLVCLGQDEMNLETAVRMRMLCARQGWDPFIQAIRYSTGENEDFSHAKNFKGQEYRIDLIGDMKTMYSDKVILCSELERKALERHMRWGTEDIFWKFEYNYHSSIASAMHHDLKIALGIPGADVSPSERTPEEKDAIRRLEHRRWNAYMRSEGYVYAPKRNDLAKQHDLLVSFDELSPEEQAKDDD